jgi:hypothetical protein
VAEPSDEKWLCDLALPFNISHHVNGLNARFKVNRNSFWGCQSFFNEAETISETVGKY